MTTPNSQSLEQHEPKSAGRDTRNVWQWLTEPADSIEEPGAWRQARLLSSLLVGLVPFTMVGALSVMLFGSTPVHSLAMWIAVIAMVMAYGLSRTKRYMLGSALTVGILSILPFAMMIIRADYSPSVSTKTFAWAILTVLIGGIFFPVTGTAILAAAHILGLLLFVVFIPEVTFLTILLPLGLILSMSVLIVIATRHRSLLEMDRLAALSESYRESEALRALLEARTRDLVRHTRYLEAAAAVGRDAASMLDPQELLSRVAAMISEQFGFYHTGIFLLDPGGEWAVLQAASSEGGRRMLARKHRLRVGGESIVGYITGRGESRVALNIGEDAVFFDNPDLPETRSEMALPLRARGEIIGALDMQSTEPEAFSEKDVAVLQTLADQVVMAISNARLFEQVQESLEAERRAYTKLSREAWRELHRARPDLGLVRDKSGISPAGDLWRPQMEAALRTGEITPGDGDGTIMAVPIKVRGQVIGVIDAHKPDDTGEWTAEEIALIETLTDQLSIALESARLYQDTQLRAAREQLTGEITARMRETLDVETVLQTAIREIGETLNIANVEVRMGSGVEMENANRDKLAQSGGKERTI